MDSEYAGKKTSGLPLMNLDSITLMGMCIYIYGQ